MIVKYLFILFFLIFFTSTTFAEKIATVNIQNLIDNNKKYNEILERIDLSQKKILDSFLNKENELEKMFSDIESSKLILNDKEINIMIDDYNNKLNNYAALVEEFNFHYENQIINIREAILKEIIVLLEKYAIQNKIDIIFDSTSYLLASNSLDITNYISEELKKIKLNLEYKSFETN